MWTLAIMHFTNPRFTYLRTMIDWLIWLIDWLNVYMWRGWCRRQRLVKSSRSNHRRHESDSEDEEEEDGEHDVADLLSTFWERRIKMWTRNTDGAQSHAADKVSCPADMHHCCLSITFYLHRAFENVCQLAEWEAARAVTECIDWWWVTDIQSVPDLWSSVTESATTYWCVYWRFC